jgi:hypothetical protein
LPEVVVAVVVARMPPVMRQQQLAPEREESPQQVVMLGVWRAAVLKPAECQPLRQTSHMIVVS